MSMATIAAEMQNSMRNGNPAVTRTLSRGLIIIYARDNHERPDEVRLAVGRREARPSFMEFKLIAEHFPVPPGDEPTFTRRNGYNILEVCWTQIQERTDHHEHAL